MTDTEREQYEKTIADLMALIEAKNLLIEELEREVKALRERLAGELAN
jgi:hypothetical protein